VLAIGTGGAKAALVSLVNEGITYTMTENSVVGQVANFTLTITGYNTIADLQGGVNAGRSGINAIALTTPNGGQSTVTGGTMLAPSGWTFVAGGISAAGCDGNGAFFCFDNSAIPPIPSTALTPGTLTFNFTATAAAGSNWNSYTDGVAQDEPHLKVDWIGTASNFKNGKLQSGYDLVSQPIPVNTPDGPPPPPPIIDAPEPGSLAILGVSLLGLGVVTARRRR
jgi:hypothetical protein